MNDFFTWSTLGTMAGATAAVTLATQFIKWLFNGRLHGGVIRAVSFGVALVVLLCAAVFSGTLDAPTAVLTVLNAVIVTLAANGLFDGLKSVTGE